MSARLGLLVLVVALGAAALWWRADAPPAPPAAAETPVVHWVATAHQRGIIGYRDPAVAVAPGGRLVAYSEGRQVRVLPIGGGVDVGGALGEGQVRHLAWIDDRRLVFEDGGAAARWQLLELGVGTRPLWPSQTLTGTGPTSGVQLGANTLRQLAVSPDGAWLAAIAAGSDGPDLWRVRLDGQELWKTTIAEGRASSPAWASPTEIACVVTSAAGGRVSAPCGAPPLATTPTLDIAGAPAFSPDGAIIYAPAANARGFLDLWRIERATGAARRLTATARDSYGPTVARDGTVVYKTQEYRTFIAELADGAVRPLTTFQAETPWWHPTEPLVSMTYGTWRRQIDDANYPDIAQEVGVVDLREALPADRPSQVLEDSDSEDQGMAWSPNGRWIVFHSHREMSDDVWLRPTDGAAPDRRITMLGRGAEVGWPRWSPDGRTVLLDGTRNGRGVMFTIGVDQDKGEVTAPMKEVATAGFDEVTHGEWLPDSRRVVAIAKEGPGRHAVLLADTTGGQPVQVLHRFASEHDFPGITVAPDGSAFTFVAPAPDGYFQLFRRALTGGSVEQLTTDPIHKSQPAWSPDGRRLAFSAWSYDASIWRIQP
ncbi:MAG: TolB family protein [Vicinamibacterales bacterium]